MWHLRLGHLPFTKIRYIFPSLNGIDANKECFCTVCPLAKQTRSTFCKSSIKTTSIFQMTHVSIWRCLRHPSRIKCNHFIIIVDDYSRFTWVKFIRNKFDFLNVFKQFYEFALTQFEIKINIVRTDNAKELSQGDTLSFYNKKGIIHQSSCVQIPHPPPPQKGW